MCYVVFSRILRLRSAEIRIKLHGISTTECKRVFYLRHIWQSYTQKDKSRNNSNWVVWNLRIAEIYVHFIMLKTITRISLKFWWLLCASSAGKWQTQDWKTHRHCYPATLVQTALQPRPEGATWRQEWLTSHHRVPTAPPNHHTATQIK